MFCHALWCLLAAVFLVAVCSQESVEKHRKPSLPNVDLPTHSFLALMFDETPISASNLVISSAKKDGADAALEKYDGQWSVEIEEQSAFIDDYSLVLKSKAKHHAISWNLSDVIKFDMDELVVQYEVKFANGMDCGGAYIKLISHSPNLKLEHFNDKTPYTIMFGPDKCGQDHKFHFIIRFKNPKTGEFEEKHAKRVTADIEKYFSDRKTHLYTLVLRSDNSFERYIDQVKVQSGNLLSDMEPPINPPEEIDDPNDKRPDDWDERETIVDKSATKPDDWDETAPEFIQDDAATKPDGWLDDEPLMIPDSTSLKPDDWENDSDGDWEPPMIENPKCKTAPGCGEWKRPMIKNPKYKGKWMPPSVPNPAYKGIWKPAKIANPNFYRVEEPFRQLTPVSAVGLELWSMTENIVFDNFLIIDSLNEASRFGKATWGVKSEAERLADPKSHSVVDAVRETYKEKPIMVLVIGLACTVPLLLCLWFICRPSTRKPVSMHKKTDAATLDDEPTTYDSNKPEVPQQKSKGDEEDDKVEEEEDTEDDLVQVPTPEEAHSDKGDGATDSNDEPEPEPKKPEKQVLRKRRSRKE